MKRTLLKRIGAVALAVAVSLTMGVTSFAATPSTDQPNNDNGGIESTSTTLNIPKGITVKGTLTKVYGPDVTYTYTVAPATVASGTNVNDGNATVGVKAGVAGGVTLDNGGQVAFESSEVNVGEIYGNLVAKVDITKFENPGIYRYLITDTTATSALFAAGITRPDDYDATRFLDVYIRSAASGLEVYGYVLQADNTLNTTKKDNTKSLGYISASEGEGEKTDVYQTINVKVGKKITGTMADTAHQFPFTINIANEDHYYYAKEGSDPTIDNDTNATSVTVSLGNNETYYMHGLNPRATITYTETNDTTETYTVTITGNDGSIVNNVSNKATDPEGTQTTDKQNVSDYTTSNSATSVAVEPTPTAYSVMTFENKLNAISPTNVVMRYAPFLFIFGAAILLLVVMRKRRSHSAE